MRWPLYLAAAVLACASFRSAPAQEAGKKGKSPEAAQKKEEFDAHAPTIRYHFKDPDMDWTFGFMLGTCSNGGMEIGEAMYTVSQIKEGDAASWQAEWIKMGDRLAARAEQTLANGHMVSACRQLQRASYYYRTGIVSMMPDDPRVKGLAKRSRSLMKKAGELMEPPLEYFEVPFEGTVLPGYFRRADRAGSRRPTFLMIGGGETFMEDLWFHTGPQAHQRGYNFVCMDLPGQGMLPWEGKFFRAAMNVPISAVIDHVLKRPEVDPERLVAFGISGGGGFAPQTAMNDSRIKAVGMNAVVVDAEQLFANIAVARTTAKDLEGFTSFHRNVVKLVAYRWGVSMDNIPGLVAANKGFTFDPAKVKCPMLLLAGAGEYADKEAQRQHQVCREKMANPKSTFILTTFDSGASTHCLGENRSLMGEIVFDWMDEVLK